MKSVYLIHFMVVVSGINGSKDISQLGYNQSTSLGLAAKRRTRSPLDWLLLLERMHLERSVDDRTN